MDVVSTLKNDKALHRNILKFATMLTVSKAISLQDAKFMAGTVATLVGFTAYHLVTKKINIPVDNPDLKNVSNTWMKVGTMLVVSQLYKGEKIDKEFMMDAAMTLLGFNVADVLVPRIIPDFKNDLTQKIVTDVSVVLISTVTKTLLMGKQVTGKTIMSASWVIMGFVLYDLIETLAC